MPQASQRELFHKATVKCRGPGEIWVPQVGPGFKAHPHAMAQAKASNWWCSGRAEHGEAIREIRAHQREIKARSESLIERKRRKAAKARLTARMGTRDDGSDYEALTRSVPKNALNAAQIAVRSAEGARHILCTLPSSVALVLEQWALWYGECHSHGQRYLDPWESPHVRRVIGTAAFFAQTAIEAPAYPFVYRRDAVGVVEEIPVTYQVSGYSLARIAGALGPQPGKTICWSPHTIKHTDWGPISVLRELGLVYSVQDRWENVPASHRGDAHAFNRYVLPEWAWPANESWGALTAVGAHLDEDTRTRLAPEIWGDEEDRNYSRRRRVARKQERLLAKLREEEAARLRRLEEAAEQSRLMDEALKAALDASVGAARRDMAEWVEQWQTGPPPGLDIYS